MLRRRAVPRVTASGVNAALLLRPGPSTHRHAAPRIRECCAAWRSGNAVGRINEVTLRRARLVLGWVTVFGGQTISVFHQAT